MSLIVAISVIVIGSRSALASDVVAGSIDVTGLHPQHVDFPVMSRCSPPLPATLDLNVSSTDVIVVGLHSESIIDAAGTDYLLVLDYDPMFSLPGSVNSAGTLWAINDLVVSLTASIYSIDNVPSCVGQQLQCSLYADVVLNGTYDPSTWTTVLSGGTNLSGGTSIGALGACAAPFNSVISEDLIVTGLTIV